MPHVNNRADFVHMHLPLQNLHVDTSNELYNGHEHSQGLGNTVGDVHGTEEPYLKPRCAHSYGQDPWSQNGLWVPQSELVALLILIQS